MSEVDDSATELALGELVDEFSARLRAGENPDPDVYAARLPERFDEVARLLRTVGSLEVVSPPSDPSGDMPQVQGSPLPLTRLGEYLIERELGRGGMGVVFLATDRTLGRRVALKLLPIQATLDPRFLERFRREARAAALLQHPNIVPVYGVGEHEGHHYYAMRFIDGLPLDRVLRAIHEGDWGSDSPDDDSTSASKLAAELLHREPSGSGTSFDGHASSTPRTPRVSKPPSASGDSGSGPPAPSSNRWTTYARNIARLGLQVAEALSYAHSHGVLHRDIKPANLILDDEGRVWITDFGLCRTNEAESLTMSTDLVGTLRYMAPEQLEGQSDVRSDVYEVGITLYELLTLRPAFGGRDRAALMRRIASDEPPRPSKVRASVPADLEAIVLKATAKLPEERYGTAAALADDLRAFLEGRAIAARRPGALHLLRLIVRRNRALATAVAIFLLVLLGTTGVYLRGVALAHDERDRQLYSATLAAAEATLSINPGTAQKHLERAPVELRGWEWEHLAAQVDDSLGTIAQTESVVRGVDVSKDGRWAATSALDGQLRVLATDGRGPTWSHATQDRQTSLVTFLDGDPLPDVRATQWLATGGVRTVELWSFDPEGEGLVRRAAMAVEADLRALESCAASDTLFLGLADSTVRCVAPDLSREVRRISGFDAWIGGLSCSADGSRLVVGLESGTVHTVELATERITTLGKHEGKVFGVDVSRTGLIASGDWEGQVRLWDLESGDLIETWQEHDYAVFEVQFSPDGERLISVSADRQVGVTDVLRRRPLRSLRGHRSVVSDLGLAEGVLVTGDSDGFVKVWDPRLGGGVALLQGHQADSWRVAFDASGRRLVSINRDATVRVWDAESGLALRVLLGVAATPWDAVFVRDEGGHDRILASYDDHALRLWNLETGLLEEEIRPPVEEDPQPTGIDSLTLTSDGRWLACIERQRYGDRRALLLFERSATSYRFARREEVSGARSAMLDADGQWVAVGCEDGRVECFQLSPWVPMASAKAHENLVGYMARMPVRGSLLTGGHDGRVVEWRMPELSPTRTIQVEPLAFTEGRKIVGMAVDESEQRLALATMGSGTQVWDVERGELVLPLRGERVHHSCTAISPDGRRVASGSWSGPIYVWDDLPSDARRARLAPATSRSEEARTLVRRLFDEQGDYDRVKAAILEAELDPELAEQALRRAHVESGSLDGLLHRVLRLLRAPDSDRTRLYEALNLSYALAKDHSDDARVRRAYGEAFLRYGRPHQALGYLEPLVAAGKLDGRIDAEARALLALTFAALGRMDEARGELEAARLESGSAPDALKRLFAEAEAALADAD